MELDTTIPPEEETFSLSGHSQRKEKSMYARVIAAQHQPGKVDEALQIYRESILPPLKQQAGFKGVLGLLERRTNKAMTISLWETEADMKVIETSDFFQAQMAKLVPLFAGTPTIETYEITTYEVVPQE
jgi:heme-degrading monooxygenase HmoA